MVKKACKLFWLVIIPSLNFDILFKATLHDSQVFCRFGVCKRLLCSCFLVTLWTDYSKHFLNNSQISRTLAVGSWTLVVHENGEIFKLFFLQELRLHTVSVVVRILRWIFSTGIGLNLHIMFNFLSIPITISIYFQLSLTVLYSSHAIFLTFLISSRQFIANFTTVFRRYMTRGLYRSITCSLRHYQLSSWQYLIRYVFQLCLPLNIFIVLFLWIFFPHAHLFSGAHAHIFVGCARAYFIWMRTRTLFFWNILEMFFVILEIFFLILQDVTDKISLRFPNLYVPGQQNIFFNKKIFLLSLLRGTIVSLILYFVPYGIYHDYVNSSGEVESVYQHFGTVVAATLVITMNLQVDNIYIYTITWLLWAFPLVVDRDLLTVIPSVVDRTHIDGVKSTSNHVSRLVFLFSCPKNPSMTIWIFIV